MLHPVTRTLARFGLVLSISLLLDLFRENMNQMVDEADAEVFGSRYWGQNSHGASDGADVPDYQKPISFYCQVS